MDKKVLDFLASHRICSLTTLLSDGSPHAAALHYSHKDEPLELYFSTENTSRKCQALLDGKTVKASVVVGFSEEEWITLQMDGDVRAILDKNELTPIQTIHYAKHPTWWRYTDYNTKPLTIISSENGSKR